MENWPKNDNVRPKVRTDVSRIKTGKTVRPGSQSYPATTDPYCVVLRST